MKIGFIKKAVFLKLLDCLDINILQADSTFDNHSKVKKFHG